MDKNTGPNVALLRQVQAHIREHPEQLNMHDFLGCISGIAKSLAKNDANEMEVFGVHGSKLLRLGVVQGFYLLSVNCWPADLRTRYAQARSPKGRASATIERIDRFIAEECGK